MRRLVRMVRECSSYGIDYFVIAEAGCRPRGVTRMTFRREEGLYVTLVICLLLRFCFACTEEYGH